MPDIIERTKKLTVMTDLVYLRYTPIVYAKIPLKTRLVPIPNTNETRMGTIQWMCRYQVQSKRKRPTGMKIYPP